MPLVLLSGFGPFESFDLNPSGAVAEALAADPPAGVVIRSAVLPVSFARAPLALDEALAGAERPALLLGLGAMLFAGFRFERCAGPALELVSRPDVDGRLPAEFSASGPALETELDLELLLADLVRRGVADAWISSSAGGFVCELTYHHLLRRAAEHGVPGLFLHVPPLAFTALARQIEVVRWVIEHLTGPARAS